MFASPMGARSVAATASPAYVTKTGVVLEAAPDAEYVAASSHGAFEGLTFDGLVFNPESPERRMALARAHAAEADKRSQLRRQHNAGGLSRDEALGVATRLDFAMAGDADGASDGGPSVGGGGGGRSTTLPGPMPSPMVAPSEPPPWLTTAGGKSAAHANSNANASEGGFTLGYTPQVKAPQSPAPTTRVRRGAGVPHHATSAAMAAGGSNAHAAPHGAAVPPPSPLRTRRGSSSSGGGGGGSGMPVLRGMPAMASAPPPQAFGTMGPPPGFHFPANHGHHTAAAMPSGRTPGRARRRLAPTALTGPGVGVGMGVQPPMVPLPTPLVNPGTTFAAAALHGGPPTFHSRGPNRGRSSSHASHSSAHSSGSGSGSHFVIAPPATPPQYHGGTRSHGRQATSKTVAAAAAAGNSDGRSHRSNSSDSNVSMSSASRRTSGTSYAAAAAGAAASTAATAVSSPVPTTARGSSANAEVGKASPGGLRAKRDGEISIFVGNLPWSVTQTELEALFAEYSVDYAHLEIGRKGKSRGWGIVRVTSASKAKRIIAERNGQQCGNRRLVVREDLPRDAGNSGGNK